VSVRDLLAAAEDRLREAGVTSPRVDAEELLAHVLGSARLESRLAPLPSQDQLISFQALVERRAAREPLQHLVGSAGFRRVRLAVGPGVFIPRPETELLAGWAVDQLRGVAGAGTPRPVAVDLCTGSGAIARALADEVPAAQVSAVELSPDAAAYAARNLAGTGVELHEGDIAAALPELDGQVDVVVANPPYIPVSEYESVDIEVRTHDPAIALWSGSDGLETIHVVEAVAHRLLKVGGSVGCEHADLQGDAAPAVFVSAHRWRDVRDHCDLLGRPRFVTATKA